MLGMIICCRNIREAREVAAEVMPLHIGGTEGNKNRRRVRREESGLGKQARGAGLPKRACTREARTLTDDLGQ
jgi:hypothetical protein